ncbi:MAG: hypothetical protein ACXQTP_02200 [Candidatus Methanofastidiosia archaeon]
MKVTDEVKKTLLAIPGVIDARFLNDEEKIKIKKLEKLAEENGAAGGLMEFINEGVWVALDKKHTVLVIADNKQGFRDPPSSWTLMVDKNRNVVGEWIPKENIPEYKTKDNVQFISEDFVIYTDRKRYGKCFFLMPPIPFPELDGLKIIKNVASGSVSAPADMYLKKVAGIEENYWTILVGFDEDD